MRRLSLLVFAVAIILASAAPRPESAEEPTVVVETTRGEKWEGKYLSQDYPVQASFGKAAITTQKIKSLEFVATDDSQLVTVTLTDHEILTGTPLNTEFTLDGDNRRTIPIQEIHRIDFRRKVPWSLLGAIVGLVTLAVMEIVLGVDNLVFLAILVDKLEPERRRQGRTIGMAAALGTRLLLLFTLSWLLGLSRPLFTLPELPLLDTPEARGISGRDLILLLGGLFLIAKSVHEMHEKLEHAATPDETPTKKANFARVILQIALIDIVFSLDSVVTAVGMVDDLAIMVAAMIVAMLAMVLFANAVGNFVNRHPTVKVLALSFLILIGVMLVAEGFGKHMDKGYVYFAMAFAVGVEAINLRLRPAKH